MKVCLRPLLYTHNSHAVIRHVLTHHAPKDQEHRRPLTV